jgi:NAD(P)H-hydrate repair Nnr-like enzyme with NAD(P)H-hydrate dehydratase domain
MDHQHMPERRAGERERAERERAQANDVHNMASDIAVLKSKLDHVEEEVTKLVTRLEFTPVKLLVYGGTGLLLSGIIGGLLTLLIKHTP